MWAKEKTNKQDCSLLIRDARDYALQNENKFLIKPLILQQCLGLVLRYQSFTSDNQVGQIPITLFPSPFPKQLYDKCLNIQPIVNELQLQIANDSMFIEQSLSSVIQVDSFTNDLLKINDIVNKEGLAQPIISCISRADYMLDCLTQTGPRELRIRQVEINAIASSMSAHSYNTQKMHRYLMSKYFVDHNMDDNLTIPKNEALHLIAQSLIKSYDLYGKSNCFILLVCEEKSPNFSDYMSIELAVLELRPDVKTIRKTFASLSDSACLGPNKELLVDNVKECAIVYFRNGYDPSNYNFNNAWKIRLLLERSRAIKCPSINFHLSGAKKFQQILNTPEKLEKFLDTKSAADLAQVFSKFWPIDNSSEEGREGYELGLKNSANLVLKPQREGGGHNIYREDIKPFLEQLGDSDERLQYILMEYINSPKEKNWLLSPHQSSLSDQLRLDLHDNLISELGIYGSTIADGSMVYQNNTAGYLVRSKKFGVEEGGVARGYAGISSLVLISDDNLDNELFYEL